jgi:hypothetical protein
VDCFYHTSNLERVYVACASWRLGWLFVLFQAMMTSCAATPVDPGRLSI